MAWSRLSSSSSQDVSKTSSRCLDQDEYICLGYASSRRLQNIFKTFSKRLQNVLLRCLQDVFRTSSRRFQDIFKTSCKNFLKKSWRRLQNVLQRFLQDIFKKFSRRLQDFFMTSLKCIIINTSSTPLWDVFNTFLRRTSKTIINKTICLDHTYDKFMVRVQNSRVNSLAIPRLLKTFFLKYLWSGC